MSGEWVGQYRIADCSSRGGDFRYCSRQTLGSPFSMRLVLDQHDDVVTGIAEIRSAFADATLSVFGQADRTGALTLTGSVQGRIPGGSTDGITDSVQLTAWATTVNGGRMTGRFAQETAGYYGFDEFRFTSRLDGEIVTLSRR